jgi:hypothetical protein
VHYTDRPAAETLLSLVMRLEGKAGGYRWQGDTRAPAPVDTASTESGT